MTRLPPPYLGAAPLGDVPAPAPVGDDPILTAYEHEGEPGAEPAADLPIGPDEVTAFLVGLGDLAARIRGPHWAIEPAETELMAPAIARQLAKPGASPLAQWIVEHGDATAIILGTALIVVPRALTEYRVIQLRREQLAAAQAEGVTYGSDAEPDYTAPGWSGDGVPGAGEAPDVSPRPTDPESLAATARALTRR